MMRPVTATILAAVATGLVLFEQSPSGKPVRAFFASVVAGETLPRRPERVTVIEVPSNAGGIHTLDAALILRAILRYDPKAVVFLDPLDADADATLLLSKLDEAKIPVVFTSNSDLEPLPKLEVYQELPAMAAFVPKGFPVGGFAPVLDRRVFFVGRVGTNAVPSNVLRFCMAVAGLNSADISGSVPGDGPGNVRLGSLTFPVDELGCIRFNPLVDNFVDRIPLGQLLLQTERAERGLITPVLEGRFRGRLVAVQRADEWGALGVAALRNNLVDRQTPVVLMVLGVLLAASLPWWRTGRLQRMVIAALVSCVILLAAMSIYPETRMPVPLLAVMLLPLLAAIPPRPK